jgi:hypothetical protein
VTSVLIERDDLVQLVESLVNEIRLTRAVSAGKVPALEKLIRQREGVLFRARLALAMDGGE